VKGNVAKDPIVGDVLSLMSTFLRLIQKTTNPARLRGTKWECGGKKRGSNDRYVSQTKRTSRTVPASRRRNPRQDVAPKDILRSTIQIWRYEDPAHPLKYSNHVWLNKPTNLIFFTPQH